MSEIVRTSKRLEVISGDENHKSGMEPGFYRQRRGKWVRIPDEWVGHTVSDKTKRQRPSKALHKHRKDLKHGENSGRRSKRLDELKEKDEQ